MSNLKGVIPFNFNSQTYNQAASVEVDKYCNGLLIENTGDEIAFVNGKRLLPGDLVTNVPGQSISIGGNLLEIYRGRIDIRFAGGGTSPAIEVMQKYYTPENRDE